MPTNNAATAAASPSEASATPVRDHSDVSLLVRDMAQADRQRQAGLAAYKLPTITPLSSFADYAAAAAKRYELATTLSATHRELQETVTAISRGFAANRDSETDRQAKDLLAGKPEEAFDGFEELNSQRARLHQRAKAYNRAVAMQDEIIAGIRSDRSIDAAEVMSEAHRDAVAGIADAIARLREACHREQAARTAVVAGGYDDRLPHMGLMSHLLGPVGQLDAAESRAREYLR